MGLGLEKRLMPDDDIGIVPASLRNPVIQLLRIAAREANTTMRAGPPQATSRVYSVSASEKDRIGHWGIIILRGAMIFPQRLRFIVACRCLKIALTGRD